MRLESVAINSLTPPRYGVIQLKVGERRKKNVYK